MQHHRRYRRSRSGFADTGGNSALRAATPEQPPKSSLPDVWPGKRAHARRCPAPPMRSLCRCRGRTLLTGGSAPNLPWYELGGPAWGRTLRRQLSPKGKPHHVQQPTDCSRGRQHRTRGELATLDTPPGTETWKPVPDFELVSSLIEGLVQHGITIVRESYATSGRDDARLFGVIDLLIPDLAQPDYGMSLGIRGANDRSMVIQATAGAGVFVCDNLAFSGESGTVVLRKKHTSRLDLSAVVPPAIDFI